MNRDKRGRPARRLPSSLYAAAAVVVFSSPISLAEPEPPQLTDSHQTFLSRLARRTLRDGALERAAYQPEYVPESLSGVEAEVVVRVWQEGFLRSGGVGRFGPIVNATREAALSAVERMKPGLPEPEVVRNLLIEIEAAGAAEPIELAGDWTKPGALKGVVEPGVHGVTLLGPKSIRRFYPSELIQLNLTLSDALLGISQAMHMAPTEIEQTRLDRFRTVQWYEPHTGADIVSFHRGMLALAENQIDARSLRDAADRIAEYMIYRQLDSGLFSYQFDAGIDRYAEADSVIGQAGAAVALSLHARLSNKSASAAASEMAIRHHLRGLTEVPEAKDAAFIASADGENKLGLTAFVCQALAEHPDRQEFADIRRKLVNGMLGLQRPSGMFLTAFPPAVRLNEQDYFPGEALLALAGEYSGHPTEQVLSAFDRAIEFYRDYFRSRRSYGFVPWQVQAFAKMAGATKRQDFIDYVYELTDWLAAGQLTSTNGSWGELFGGVPDPVTGLPDISTALYLQAFADALTLARSQHDTVRVRRYENAVRSAARFVIQLQVRPPEAYSMRSPKDAIGGVRAAPALNRIRIDHCQHALIGLIKARQALYPDGH